MHVTLGLFMMALPVLLACSGGPTPEPTPAPDPVAAYVGRLTEITERARQSRRRFEDLTGPIFPRFAPDEMQAKVLFNALEQASISDTRAEMLQMLESLAPPERFAEDHAIYLKVVREQLARASAIDEAIKSKDLPHVHLEMAELIVAGRVARAEVSPEFCRHITPRRNGLDSNGEVVSRDPCTREQTPGGEYGAAINRLARTFFAEFLPRASFPPGMTPDELLQGLTYVQPAIVAFFEKTLADLDNIKPPPEYEVGHQVLYDYLDELLSTARAIDRAVADKDYDRVQREFERSSDVGRTADDRLPENYRPLVEVIFKDPGED